MNVTGGNTGYLAAAVAGGGSSSEGCIWEAEPIMPSHEAYWSLETMPAGTGHDSVAMIKRRKGTPWTEHEHRFFYILLLSLLYLFFLL